LLASVATGTYTGTVTYPLAEKSDVTVALSSATAIVTLAPGHAAEQQVRVTRANGVIRFVVPGLPVNVTFALRSKGALLVGTETQGAAKGTVKLRKGTSVDTQLGYFDRPLEVARFTRFGYPTAPFAIDSRTGAFGPVPTDGTRIDVRQFEVRFRSGPATLAGTLTVPPGPGPFPAAVYVSGSGPTLREESHWLDGLFVSHGVAVLAYDKRGIGQSGGTYPGDLATDTTIATLAGDAVAAVQFLRAQSGIDPARVGFYGISQGGWIIPQAAVRAGPAISWAVIESGPTVTQGESDTFAGLAGNLPIAEADRQARAFASGYDPKPWLDKLAIPVLWLYGGQDRNQPAAHSLEIVHSLAATHAFQTALFPDVPHGLFDRSGYPPGLFGTILDWLGSSGPFSR
jgi:pimeloyl-ACP methyl ester carboxylesterase